MHAWKVVGGLTLAVLVSAITPASAGFLTGASYLNDKTAFHIGFACGTVAGYLGYGQAESKENAEKIGNCLADGNISSGVFADAVAETLRSDPSMLPKDATYAVLTTLYKICPVR